MMEERSQSPTIRRTTFGEPLRKGLPEPKGRSHVPKVLMVWRRSKFTLPVQVSVSRIDCRRSDVGRNAVTQGFGEGIGELAGETVGQLLSQLNLQRVVGR